MSKKWLSKFFKVASATNYMNTVSTATDTVMDGATAKNIASTHVRAVYSKEIEFKAMPIMRFVQFAKYKEELGVQPGLAISMLTYNNITQGGALTEGTRMTTKSMSASMSTIEVAERGNAISVSELALKASFTSLMEDATTLLARDMAIVLDCELRDALASGLTSTIYGRYDKDSAKISARTSLAATNILSTASIKDAVEILATNNCPKFGGDYYVCFVHPYMGAQVA